MSSRAKLSGDLTMTITGDISNTNTSISKTSLDAKFNANKLGISELLQLSDIARRKDEMELLRELEKEISKRHRGEKYGKN